ncbi:MAG TPA: hypothetical protein VHA12_02465 [Candidatus Nanoarchaeia archaeon]|nr:hypothetical protein [Candidatus Nanoarchaeia archaeon]
MIELRRTETILTITLLLISLLFMIGITYSAKGHSSISAYTGLVAYDIHGNVDLKEKSGSLYISGDNEEYSKPIIDSIAIFIKLSGIGLLIYLVCLGLNKLRKR